MMNSMNGNITPYNGNSRGQIVPVQHPLAPYGCAELLQARSDGSIIARPVDGNGVPLCSHTGEPIYIAIAPAAMPAMQWQGYAPMQPYAPMPIYAPLPAQQQPAPQPAPQQPAQQQPQQHEHYHYHDSHGVVEALVMAAAFAIMGCTAFLGLYVLSLYIVRPAPNYQQQQQ